MKRMVDKKELDKEINKEAIKTFSNDDFNYTNSAYTPIFIGGFIHTKFEVDDPIFSVQEQLAYAENLNIDFLDYEAGDFTLPDIDQDGNVDFCVYTKLFLDTEEPLVFYCYSNWGPCKIVFEFVNDQFKMSIYQLGVGSQEQVQSKLLYLEGDEYTLQYSESSLHIYLFSTKCPVSFRY